MVLATDHPRGCGEHTSLALRIQPRLGSSPRMRGARKVDMMAWRSVGIIPADAGSTTAYPKNIADKRDHPRGCGEHQGGISHDG